MRRVVLGSSFSVAACVAANGEYEPADDPPASMTSGAEVESDSTSTSAPVPEGGSSDGGAGETGPGSSGGGELDGGYDSTGPEADTEGTSQWVFLELGPVVELDAVGYHDDDPTLRADRLEIFFASTRPAVPGDVVEDQDIYVSTRARAGDMWGEPMRLPEPINTGAVEGSPELSAGGLVMTFSSDRGGPGASGGLDVYYVTRPNLDAPWGSVGLVEGINDAAVDASAVLTDDLTRVFFCSIRDGVGNEDLFVADRLGVEGPFGEPVRLRGEINSSYMDCNPTIDALGERLVFATSRSGDTDADLVVVEDEGGQFGPIVYLEGVNTAARELDPWLSPDGDELFFTRVLPIDDARIIRAVRVR